MKSKSHTTHSEQPPITHANAKSVGTGILPSQTIDDMIAKQTIYSECAIEEDQVQPASIDLRLGDFAYPVDASFLPGSQLTVMEKMHQLDTQVEEFKLDLRHGAVLERGRVYVIPLLESIHLKNDIAGFANPKSSTGRLDILTRLIADYSTVFDQVPRGYKGKLYIEVAPKSFSVVAKTGARLNQLRFRRSTGSTAMAIASEEWKNLLSSGKLINQKDGTQPVLEDKGMLRFTVDLQGEDGSIIGYRARKHARRVDLERRNYPPLEFWEPLYHESHTSLILDPDEFYILMTKEAVAVPPDYAAEMVPYDTRAGEFRVHYAGFFDPGFGWDSHTNSAGNSRAVLEVRSHDVPFLLEHGQTVGWLRYERMASTPHNLYGQAIKSNYQGQKLKLAKQFKEISH